MIDPIYKLKKVCAEQRQDLSDHLAGGGAVDYSEYCKAVGAIQCLDLVLREIEELEKKSVEE
jgi:hypothetical protein